MKMFGRKLTSIALLIAILFSFAFTVEAAGVNLEPVEGIYLWPTNVEVDGIIDTEVKYSGNCSYKIVNHTPMGAMKYFIICWQAPVEAGKNYIVGGKFKAEEMNNVTMSFPTLGEKISVTSSFGSTYDWKHVEVEVVPTKSETFSVYVQMENTGTMWFDDIFIMEKGSSVNLIENGDFELKEVEKEEKAESTVVGDAVDMGVGTFADYEDYKAQRDKIKASPSFTVEDMEKFNNIGSVPLYRADGITTDASGAGWESFKPFVMTLDRVHYVDYMNVGNDIHGEVKVAQDDENFYIHAVVKDDKFYPLTGTDNYWKGDGLQFTFSQDNVFGIEIGTAWNDDEKAPKAYSSFISGEKLDAVKVCMNVTEGQQVYDIVVPWTSAFEKGKPDRFQFNICFNDNDDGTNRHDCMEIEPGILLGKAAKGCPILVPMDNGKDWIAWTEGATSGNQNSEVPGVAYLVNFGDTEKVFTIKSEQCGIDATVTVPAGTGASYNYSYLAKLTGIYGYDITIEADGESITDVYSVTVSYPEGTPEEALALHEQVKAWSAELDSLYEKVQEMGYEAPYEYANVYTVRLFIDRILVDIGKKLYYRIGYWEKSLGDLYTNTKAELEKIISGEKIPMSVPEYQGGDYTIDGTVIYADTVWNGVTESRPVIFWGGLAHFPLIDQCIEDMPNIGANCVVFEYTMGTAIKDGGSVNFWTNLWTSGGVTGVATKTTEEAYEGKYSYKLTMTNDMAPNRYYHLRLTQNNLKPETNYTFSFYGKANNVGNLRWGVGSASKSIKGTSDWTQYTQSFKTGPSETSKFIDFMMDSKSTAFYFDNMVLVEDGKEENLFADREWNFEVDPVIEAEFAQNKYYVQPLPLNKARLDACEERNLSVGLLLSVAHNLPQFIYDTFPETWLRSNGFNTSSFGNDKYRELVEKYLRYMMENIEGYECVNYIDIANEVQMNSWSNTGYYLPRFKNWLRNKYGTIENLNAATGASYNDFEEIKWPTGVNTEEPLSMEYDMYNDWELSDFHRFCANIIHEYVPDMPVWSKIMDYTHDYGDIHLYAYYSNGTGLDAYSDVFNVNGCDAYNYLDWNHGRLIKEQWYDYMVGTNYAPVFNGEDHVIKDSSANYDANQAFWVANDLWQGAIHYRGQTDLWLWDSREDEGITKGSILCRPDVISETSKAGLDMNRLSWEIAALQKEKREVGILYSDPSGLLNTSYPGCQYYAYEATLFSGQKVNYISERTIDRIHDTKVLLLAQVSNVQPQTLVEIKKYIENGGEVVIIGEKSLKKDWYHRASDATLVNYIYANARFVDAESDRFKQGLTKGSVEEIYRAVNDAIEDAGIQVVKVVDAETLQEVYNIEYTSTIYDGNLLINITNWADKTQNLKVLVNGKEVTGFTELRSMEKVEGDIVSEYIKPMLLSVAWDGVKFLDTIGHWSENAVKNLTEKGLVSGVSETRYAPERQITRAEYLALLMRASGFDAKYRNQIADVSVDAWYADNVAAALANGIIGTENFRPNDVITREEMADLAIKTLEKKIGAVSGNGKTFTDLADAKYADAVATAAGLGIISGYEDGSFRPNAGLTRAEVASVIERYLKKIN